MKNTKRILIALVSALLCFSMVACGKTGNTEQTTTAASNSQTTTVPAGNESETTVATDVTPTAPVAENALDLFQQIWNAYLADTSIPEENKLSFTIGGDEKWLEDLNAKQDEFYAQHPNPTDEELIEFNKSISGPGAVEATNVDYLISMSFPSGQEGLVVSAASVMHGMLRNNFTGAVYETKSAADAKTLAEALKASIPATHWVCGQPDIYTVVTVDQFVIAVFGAHKEEYNMTPVADLLKVTQNMFDNEIVLVDKASATSY